MSGFIDYLSTNYQAVLTRLWEHVQLTAIAVFVAILIGVPLGILTGLVLRLPAPIVFLCMKMDSPVKLVLGSVRMFSGKWIRNVTRAEEG